jgi:hypothetical protein
MLRLARTAPIDERHGNTKDCHAGTQKALGIRLSFLEAKWESSLPQLGGETSPLEANKT